MKTVNLPSDIPGMKDLIRGDTFPGLSLTFKDNTGAAINITDFDIIFQIRKKFDRDSELLKECTIGSGITIIDASTGQAKINQFDLDFGYGNFYYQLQVTTDEGFIDSPMGGLFNVPNDLANPTT